METMSAGISLVGALIVAAAVAWAAVQIVNELRAARTATGGSDRGLGLLNLFGAALAATQQDPRAFLVWQPIAKTARQLFPDEFAALDRATGGTFPFSRE